MKLYLSPGITTKQLNLLFQKDYPFLKLNFFKKTGSGKAVIKHHDIVPDDAVLIGRNIDSVQEIRFTKRSRVKDVEEQFKNAGLNMQVFRKSGHSWLVTTTSDDMTLADLESLGEEIAIQIPEERENDVDVY